MGRWKRPTARRERLAMQCPERSPAPPGRINVYRCHCGQELVTIDIHDGVTWMIETCEGCGGVAQSQFYNESATRGKTPTHEFYMPLPAEFVKLDPMVREHVAKGGLLLRKRAYIRLHDPATRAVGEG